MNTRWNHFFAALLISSACHSAPVSISGEVVSVNGDPIPHVRVRISGAGGAAATHTVFTGAEGEFHTGTLTFAPTTVALDVFRIGWELVSNQQTHAAETIQVAVTMKPIDNTAHQVPASAWLGGDTESLGYRMANLHCANCHQLGAQRVRDFATKLLDHSAPDRAEAWVTRAAEDLAGAGRTVNISTDADADALTKAHGWDAVVQYMRWKTMRLGEDQKLRWGLEEGSPFYNALLEPATSLFSPRDMEIIIPYLVEHFPTRFDVMKNYDDVERLGNYGVTTSTFIEEYALPTFGWTREIALAPGSDKVWFLETDKHRLGALSPIDGKVTWYPVPLKGEQGPHTMNADEAGNIWVALEDSFHIGKLNTVSEDWRLYPPPEGTSFGVTHDFAFNSQRHVEPDSRGRIWITDLGKNELWALNTDSGVIETFPLPIVGGESSFHSLLYGAAIDRSRDRIWWAQLFGVAGSFDTERDVTDRILPYQRGEGPRRLAIEDGVLWVPLFGSSELSKIDTNTGLEIARYPIPDRGGSPYGITLDKRRNAIWLATCNSDRIYRFDIAAGRWRHYPLPRREAYIRVIEVHPDTGDIWTTYSNLPVGKRDPAVWDTEYANNMIVRLHPGD